jgi:hypothetical protein
VQAANGVEPQLRIALPRGADSLKCGLESHNPGLVPDQVTPHGSSRSCPERTLPAAIVADVRLALRRPTDARHRHWLRNPPASRLSNRWRLSVSQLLTLFYDAGHLHGPPRPAPPSRPSQGRRPPRSRCARYAPPPRRRTLLQQRTRPQGYRMGATATTGSWIGKFPLTHPVLYQHGLA